MTHELSNISITSRRLATIMFCAAVMAPRVFDASIPVPTAGTRTALQLLETKPGKGIAGEIAITGSSGRP